MLRRKRFSRHCAAVRSPRDDRAHPWCVFGPLLARRRPPTLLPSGPPSWARCRGRRARHRAAAAVTAAVALALATLLTLVAAGAAQTARVGRRRPRGTAVSAASRLPRPSRGRCVRGVSRAAVGGPDGALLERLRCEAARGGRVAPRRPWAIREARGAVSSGQPHGRRPSRPSKGYGRAHALRTTAGAGKGSRAAPAAAGTRPAAAHAVGAAAARCHRGQWRPFG